MSIKQLNASYLAADDRLLLRFNTLEDAEFRFWLTRRVTLFILAATQHLMVKNLEQTHTPEAAKAIADFGKEAVLTHSENPAAQVDQYQAGNTYPLGADPVLVMDVKCGLEKQGLDDVLSLDLVLPGGANINLKLAGNTLQALRILLEQLREHARWGDVPQVAQISSEAEESQLESGKQAASIH